jgi:hypothetical protein
MIDAPATLPDNRLTFLDQAMFLGLRATGQEAVMQCVWVYEHPVDFDELRRFHRDFGFGLAGRRIERSPLPFGRHRWVSSLGPASVLDIAETPRPRAEVGDWADERAQLPVDPEWGPGWHLGVLPMTDGSTAVSLVGSHCLGDGGGAMLTTFEAVKGNRRDIGYPHPGSRTRRRAMAIDARETIQGLPELVRTLAAAAKIAVRRRPDRTTSPAARPGATGGADGDRNVVVPAVATFIDLDEWDACAKARGGNSYSLVAGFAANLGARLDRRRPADGKVDLVIPINDRMTLDDTRANAVALAHVSVDPTEAIKDLSGARTAIREGIQTARDEPDEAFGLLAAVPFIPKRAVKLMAGAFLGFADPTVSCSNLGDIDPVFGRPDGTEAEYVYMRGVDRFVTLNTLEQRQGILTVVAGRIGGKISLAVIGYQPGAENSKPWLRRLVGETLGDFGLTGVIE